MLCVNYTFLGRMKSYVVIFITESFHKLSLSFVVGVTGVQQVQLSPKRQFWKMSKEHRKCDTFHVNTISKLIEEDYFSKLIKVCSQFWDKIRYCWHISQLMWESAPLFYRQHWWRSHQIRFHFLTDTSFGIIPVHPGLLAVAHPVLRWRGFTEGHLTNYDF